MKQKIIVFALLLVLLAGCGPKSVPATPTSTPTSTAIPTATASATPTPKPTDENRELTVDGMQRTYLIHIPASLDLGQPIPLVFAFHGYQETPDLMKTLSDFNKVADQNGFIVIYPAGSGDSDFLSWNAGGCCGYAVSNNVDEAAFVRQMIADVGTLATVDTRRIYATGFSNGALLSFRLACEMSDTFAAIAPVAGAVMTKDPCQPQQPVSVLQVHGMADTTVPFEGGYSSYSRLTFPSVADSLSIWTQKDGCTGTPQEVKDGKVTHIVYPGCSAGLGVELYKIDGLSHTWPLDTKVLMSATIWDFFAAHPKP